MRLHDQMKLQVSNKFQVNHLLVNNFATRVDRYRNPSLTAIPPKKQMNRTIQNWLTEA